MSEQHISKSLELIDRSQKLIEDSAVLLLKRPEHAKFVFEAVGRLALLMEGKDWYDQDSQDNTDS